MKNFLSLFKKESDTHNSDKALDSYIAKKIKEEKAGRENIIPPDFHILEVIEQGKTMKFYFVNKGGSISGIKLTPLDDFEISVNPEDRIKTNESGCFTVRYSDSQSFSELKFKISCATTSARVIENTFVLHKKD